MFSEVNIILIMELSLRLILVKIGLLLFSLAASIAVSLLFFEVYLRRTMPPQLNLSGVDILLERNKTIENKFDYKSHKIKDSIIVRKNSLGLRGPEPPLDFAGHKTLIAVGGSTTECIYLSEGKTWADHLQTNLKKDFPDIWINNAGIDGHSTRGHTKLMEQYLGRIKPDYILIMAGINDIALGNSRKFDAIPILQSAPRNSGLTEIFNRSMVLRYALYMLSPKGGHTIISDSDLIINYDAVDPVDKIRPLDEKDLSRFKKSAQEYKVRLEKLIVLAKSYSIKPILVTQSAVYGPGIDPVTKKDMAKIAVSDFTEKGIYRRGGDKWQILQIYNQATKDAAHKHRLPFIDLASKMPKNTAYYYDYIHYTEEGAAKVGEIIADGLREILKQY